MKIITKISIVIMIFLAGCSSSELKNESKEASKTNTETIDYNEKFRLQYHFMPEKAWMNDPNGMVFYKGEYHVFYQYFPNGIEWGPMHWGHAVSKDLMHWTHLPIALAPDKLGYIFSGSVVVDKENSSGLFNETGEGLVAIFTHAGSRQHQSIAYSSDSGRTWKKYEKNPVIRNSPKLKMPDDFRDPKVFWSKDFNRWILILAAKDQMEIWTSKNLINWEKNSEFGKTQGSHGGVWECPDLIRLKVEGTEEQSKWVMVASINPGNINGGSATQYFIGDLVEEEGKIKFNSSQKKTQWLDGGMDNYAGVTWSNTEDKYYFMGWMSNWEYAAKTPTKTWRGAMTIPRELTLEKINDEYIVRAKPVENIKNIFGKSYFTDEKIIPNKSYNVGKDLAVSRIKIEIKNINSENFNIELKSSDQNKVSIGYDFKKLMGYVDRTNAVGGVEAENRGAFQGIHRSKVPGASDNVTVEILVDKSSVEVFFNNGTSVITDLIFPIDDFTEFKIVSNGEIEVKKVEINKIESVWK